MSHLLVVELPGGNDSDALAAALAGGHRFTFLSGDPAHYWAQADVAALLAQAEAVLDAGNFAGPHVAALLADRHRADPFDALLCLQDLRIAESAALARALGLRHLNPATAVLARDKAAVRAALVAAGLPQPPCQVARGPAQLVAVVEALGMPVIIKPVDGFGSQNIFALRHPADLALLRQMPHIIADAPGAYGLGVVAHGAMLVERLLEGQLVGCDTMSSAGQHRLLGVNEKLFFPAPSFAIAGGCFTANCGQFAGLEAYVFGLLDAIGFDHGAAHIEIMLTPDGPMLVEINPRLVGARIPRLISAALGRCVHDDVMVLHTMGELPPPASTPMHAVTRWVVANEPGILAEIRLPHVASPGFVQATMLARPGQAITPPFDNADRLGFVMTRHTNRATAEALAEQIVAQTQVVLAPAAAA